MYTLWGRQFQKVTHSKDTREPMNPPDKRFTLMALAVVLVLIVACDKSTEERQVLETGLASDGDWSLIVERSTIAPEISEQWPEARFATTGKIQAAEQRVGDPEAGRRALLEESYVNCGLPERVFRQLQGDTPVISIPGRTDKANGLPYNVNAVMDQEGVPIVSSNCLTCHATPLFGELVVGLGNEFLDFTGDASARVERAGTLVQGADETRSWERFADRISAIAPFIKPHTLGVNPANNLTFALIAHRRAEDNTWSDEPLLELPPVDPPPVSVPPWWRMSKKPAMFSLGEGRLDHARIMMAASMLCSDSPEELARIDEFAPDIRAFIASLKPPEWPFDVDESLAAVGRDLFEVNCSRCHGTYGPNSTYPARLVPIAEIQTDSTLIDFAHGDGVPYVDWYNRSYYGELSTAAPGAGYVAPPLDGIWATAPYLHNGSVPTVRALLDSAQRPALWRRLAVTGEDPSSYDSQDMGWRFDSLSKQSDGKKAPSVYDAALPGYSNSGHYFGDHFNSEQRSAVIEYLKVL